jgi:hypothetical protein
MSQKFSDLDAKLEPTTPMSLEAQSPMKVHDVVQVSDISIREAIFSPSFSID